MKTMWALPLLMLAACNEAEGPKDYIKIAGGGLTFNYRFSQATMVLVGKRQTPFPDGAVVEGLFQVPDQAEPRSVRVPAIPGKLLYKLETAPLLGFTKGGRYKVTLRLLDKDGQEIEREETHYVSDVDQSTLPTQPLVDGPGHTPRLENL